MEDSLRVGNVLKRRQRNAGEETEEDGGVEKIGCPYEVGMKLTQMLFPCT